MGWSHGTHASLFHVSLSSVSLCAGVWARARSEKSVFTPHNTTEDNTRGDRGGAQARHLRAKTAAKKNVCAKSEKN